MDIRRQKFLVLGLSKSGEAAALYLLSQGAETYVHDDAETEKVRAQRERLEALGARWMDTDALAGTVDKIRNVGK